jgi:Putative peptidoglycan binding domain
MEMPLIRLGSHGPAVRELKVLLNHALKPSPGLTPTNEQFGPNTRKAVEQFQRAAYLKVDGLVGHDTWTALLGRASPAVKHDARLAALGHPHGPHQPHAAVSFSEGVKNPHHRDPHPAELAELKAHQKKAGQYVDKALRVLRNMKYRPAAAGAFLLSFLGGDTIFASSGKSSAASAATLQYANRAANNYATMLAVLNKGGIAYKVFDGPVKSDAGSDAMAYTGFDRQGNGTYIAFSKPLHLDSVESIQMDTFIHELAHYAWHADHAYGSTVAGVGQTNAVDWETALNGADRYAGYAVTVWTEP